MTAPYVVAVTGGRDYLEWKVVKAALDAVHAARAIDVLVHGGADGADSIAMTWAVENCVQLCEFRVTKRQWDRLGRSAGPRRNWTMLTVARPALLVAFPGGTGTADCVRQAKRFGIEVRIPDAESLLALAKNSGRSEL